MTAQSRLRGQRLLLLAASLLFCSLLIEGALRLLLPLKTFVNPLSSFHQIDAQLGWRGRPGVEGRFRKVDFDVLVRHDERGFRTKASVVLPAAGSPVVAVLGDSFTWGWGVNNDEVFTDRLQQLLGPTLDVRNFGLNAYGTVQEFLLLKQILGEGLRPARVVLMIFENDFYDNISAQGDRPAFRVIGTNVSLINCPISKRAIRGGQDWMKKSYLLSAIAYVADYTKEKRRIRKLTEQVFQADQISEEARLAMNQALEQIHEICRQADARLLCVYVTKYGEARSPAPSPARQVIHALCDSLGLPLLDLTADFAGLPPIELDQMYFPHDEHWTAKGHALAASLLSRRLQEPTVTAPRVPAGLPDDQR